jgi:hypothetical protein
LPQENLSTSSGEFFNSGKKTGQIVIEEEKREIDPYKLDVFSCNKKKQ